MGDAELPPAPPRPHEQPQPSGLLQSLLGVLQSVATMATVAGVIPYYLGWVYLRAQYQYFGIDHRLLGLSSREYLMAGAVSPSFWPVVIATVVAMVALRLRGAFQAAFREPGRGRHAMAAGLALGPAGAGCLALAGVLVVQHHSLPQHLINTRLYVAGPLLLGVGTVLIVLGIYLFGEGRRAERPRHVAGAPGPRPGYGHAAVLLSVLLVGAATLWAVANYAEAIGAGRAAALAGRLDRVPGVVVYSRECRPFELDDIERATGVTDGVREERLPGDGAGCRYSGLRQIATSPDGYWLVSKRWEPGDRVIMLPRRGGGLRFEVFRPASPAAPGGAPSSSVPADQPSAGTSTTRPPAP